MNRLSRFFVYPLNAGREAPPRLATRERPVRFAHDSIMPAQPAAGAQCANATAIIPEEIF
jgi:hypothetical protein